MMHNDCDGEQIYKPERIKDKNKINIEPVSQENTESE